jgi:hypothetical protein
LLKVLVFEITPVSEFSMYIEPARYEFTEFTAATASAQFAVVLQVTKELRMLKVTVVSYAE